MTDVVLTVDKLGKSYRTYAHQTQRVIGWLTGTPRGFEDNWVLREISFSLARGEGLGVLGRNGAGKSTLLRLIAGTIAPTEGSLHINGRVNAILELGVGFNPEFTGRENVLHSLGLMGHDHEAIAGAMPAIEAFAEIGDDFDRPLRVYSSGMQMRLAFASATCFRPDILIIDEAMAVGDAFFQAKCFDRIRQLRDGGTALLFVSHSAGDIAKHCERAIFIKDGRIGAEGPAREVSNVYLDDLFGKGRAGAPPQAAAAGSGDDAAFTRGSEDVFNTRPFYRKDEHRWGDGGAAICDYAISADGRLFPAQCRTHQKLSIAYKVAFERAIERPVFGLLIKTLDGLFVYGTNSELASSEVKQAPVAAGEIRVASFEFPLALNSGSYLISLGISEEADSGQLVPLDRRYDAILLPIENPRVTVGHLDLDARFRLSAGELVA